MKNDDRRLEPSPRLPHSGVREELGRWKKGEDPAVCQYIRPVSAVFGFAVWHLGDSF